MSVVASGRTTRLRKSAKRVGGMIRRYSRTFAGLGVVRLLLCAVVVSHAHANVVDDLRNLIRELANAPDHVKQICLDAFNALSTEIENYALSLTNNAVSERGLTATAAADTASTVVEARRLQAAGKVNLQATTMQVMLDAQAQTDQLSRDTGAGLAQISGVVAAIKRAERQGYDNGSQAAISFVNSLLSPLDDYLHDLLSHPWDFDLADVRMALAALSQAINDAPQEMKDAVAQATQNDTAHLKAIVTDLQQKRLEAQRLAKAASDALTEALGQPRVSSGMPQSVDDFVAPDLGTVASRVVTTQQAGINGFYDRLDLLASKVWVSAQQEQPATGVPPTPPEPQSSGTPAPTAQGPGPDLLAIFGIMPDFKLEESEVAESDRYQFGYLPDAPRLEGRRTTVNYWLIPGSPMPGALAICRHFADATRRAGGEVLYDNSRNIITVYVKQAGQETWAEFACDKDRYRVNIIERGSQQSENSAAASSSSLVKQAQRVNPPAKGTSGDFHQGSHFTQEIITAAGAGAASNAKAYAPMGFSIVQDTVSGGWAAPTACADPPQILYRRGFTKGCGAVPAPPICDQISRSTSHLVDNNTWSCHTQKGVQVQGALVTDRPLN